MKKITFLMSLVLIISTINAQEASKLPMQKANTASGVTLEQKINKAEMKSTLRERGLNRTESIKTTNPVKSAQILNRATSSSRAVRGVIFYEDFEDYDYDLPPAGGWLTIDNSLVALPFSHWTVQDYFYFGEMGLSPAEFPIIDDQNVTIFYNDDGEGPHNDWLISPAISLTAGVTYQISFYVSMVGESPAEEKLALHIGTAQSDAAMNATPLWSNEGDMAFQKITVNYTPSATGNYFLGFYSYSDEYTYYTAIDNVMVKEEVNCDPVETLPLVQNFEDDSYECWTMISNNAVNGPDGLGYYPMGIYYEDDSETNITFAFSSFNPADDYNQYLISPALPNNTGLTFTFDYAEFTPFNAGVEKFRVGYSSTTNNVAAFTWGAEEIATNIANFLQYSGTAPAGTKYIAINYYSDCQYMLGIDNIVIDGTTDVPIVKDNNKINIIQKNGEIQVTVSENSTIRVLDISGRVFGNYNASANSTLNIYQPAGLYLFEVTSNSGVSTRKLIVK